MAAVLSTRTITGSCVWICILSHSCCKNLTSLTASDSANHSASVLDKVTDCWAFDFQTTGTPCTYILYPLTLLLVSGSFA